jgi:hypothetical protein
MFWLSIISLVIMALALGVVLASLVGLAWLWWRVLRRPKSVAMGASCGQCGYGVRGISSTTCPECGHDLREVGIITPRRRGQVGPLGFMLTWTLCLPLPALIISAIAIGLGPKRHHTSAHLELTPRSQSFTGVQLKVSSTSHKWTGAPISTSSSSSSGGSTKPSAPTPKQFQLQNYPRGSTPDLVQLTRTQPTGSATGPATMPTAGTARHVSYSGHVNVTGAQLNVTPATLKVHATDKSGQTIVASKPLSPAVIETWLTASPNVQTSPRLKKEAAELAQTLRSAAQGKTQFTLRHFTSTGHGSSDGNHAALWFVCVVIGFWVVLYAGGIVLFVRIRRRRQAAAQQASDASHTPAASPTA